MIKVGQLRRCNLDVFELFCEPILSPIFFIVKNSGKFFNCGFATRKMELQYKILASGCEITSGWSESQLESMPKAVK